MYRPGLSEMISAALSVSPGSAIGRKQAIARCASGVDNKPLVPKVRGKPRVRSASKTVAAVSLVRQSTAISRNCSCCSWPAVRSSIWHDFDRKLRDAFGQGQSRLAISQSFWRAVVITLIVA
jgi:hypothetical protein